MYIPSGHHPVILSLSAGKFRILVKQSGFFLFLMTTKSKDRDLSGRGAGSNQGSRFLQHQRAAVDDGWEREIPDNPRTQLLIDSSRSILNRNQSPDVPFDRSINPYKGCEHGCIYCFARPTHAYLDLSPGLDFETRIYHKPDAPTLLRRELAKPGYSAAPIALGINTDAYQPSERRLRLTRALLEVLLEHRHPLSIVTKSALIERDLDLLTPLAELNLLQVMLSITGLDGELSRRMEPRAAAPARRLQTLRTLTGHGIPTGVLFAPLIPALNDHDLEAVLEAASDAGATSAGYVMLRLPHEVGPLFTEWLQQNYPLKAEHVMNAIRGVRGGKNYTAKFGERMTGSGDYATLIAQRFRLACRRLGLNREDRKLDCSKFQVPAAAGDQLALF